MAVASRFSRSQTGGPLVDDFRPEAEDRAVLEAAFRRLKAGHRTVIALHYAAGLTLTEVAAVLGVPSGTVKSRLNAALNELRRMVDG